jgi:hypothetical protein
MTSAPELLQALLAGGEVADEVQEWLVRAFVTWLRQGGAVSLPAALGLHDRPYIVRLRLRDFWLREAARLLAASRGPRGGRSIGHNMGPWTLARRLHSAVDSFGGGNWLEWRRLTEPPPTCSRVEAALWLALRCCDQRPATVQQYANIIAGTQVKSGVDLDLRTSAAAKMRASRFNSEA